MEGENRNPRVSLLKKYDIPIDHLSFEYIETCTDKKELERIARILRSGEEGNYPDLLKTVENQLRQIAPDSRILRVETPVLTKESFSNEEWKELEVDLQSWENEMKIMDEGLGFEKRRFETIGNKNLPEIRKIPETKPDNKVKKELEVKKIKVETNKKNERIKSGDYAAWDKFDVDKELLKLDLEDERKEEKNAKIKREMEKQTKIIEEKKIEPLNIDTDCYSDVEQQILASQAKDRGNECFKSEDYELALKYYKVSLKLCQSATTYNNRAMTYIKMKNYEEALRDCNEVLKMEPNNVKALHRRATSYQNLPGEKNNELALKDLLKIISIEPTNRVVQTDLQALKKKLNIQDIGKKFRMMIEESGNGEMKKLLSKSSSLENKFYFNDNDITAVRKLPLTYYGPSTSTFQCEPYSMTHRMLAGPTFSRHVMCKCNSNATKQNPLCYACGERLSRPRKKSKSVSKFSANQSEGSKGRVSVLNKEITESNARNINLESKKLNEIIGVNAENGNYQVKNEVKSKSAVNEENERSKLQADPKLGNSLDKEHAGNCNEIKFNIANTSNEKSAGQNSKTFEVIEHENERDTNICNKEGNEGVEHKKNELMNEQKSEFRSKEEKLNETEEINGNDLDLNLKERKNMDNEQCKDALNDVVFDLRDSGYNTEQSTTSDNSGRISCNDTTCQNITEIDHRCLPSTSSQNESKSDTKKSRSKTKKSKEPRPDGIRLRYSEPVKIVQATKYLIPTSTEPKSDPKEDAIPESKNQFKNFVPSRKCSNTEGGVLKSNTASFSVNVKDKECRSSPQNYTSGSIKRDCEGNKENILENGNEPNCFKNCYSDHDTTPIGSSFEFINSWLSMRKSDESYEKRAEMIRFLRPEDLKTGIGNNLDSDMLKSLLECLEKHFLDNDPKKVTSFLKELPRIPRFDIINLFLNRNEREVLERLIETTEKKGFLLSEEVKKSLKTSF